MKNNTALLLFAVILVFAGCKNQSDKPMKTADPQDAEQSLEKVNRYLVKSEKEDIENYIRRHGWDMLETGSGLRYMIYENGTGENASFGKVVTIKYKLWLINGDLVYSSEKDGLKVFQVGKGGVESGLEEGILMLKKGDKARFIMPAHLAHGLLGDENKIPPRTAIIYDLELVELN